MKKESEESCDKKRDDNNFELPDETSMNNIDLGGILNLATEDTLNIRYLEILMDKILFLIPRNFREFFWNIHYIWSLPLKICVIIGKATII